MCKVLIVDDECNVRVTLQGFLTDKKYEAKAAANEGGALAAATQESFDFACVDVRLHDGGPPDESGLSLAMALRALNPQIRIILLTQYVQTHQIVRAIRYHGAVGFIDKKHANWCQQVLDTIAQVCSEETGQPDQARTARATSTLRAFASCTRRRCSGGGGCCV